MLLEGARIPSGRTILETLVPYTRFRCSGKPGLECSFAGDARDTWSAPIRSPWISDCVSCFEPDKDDSGSDMEATCVTQRFEKTLSKRKVILWRREKGRDKSPAPDRDYS